MDIFIYVLKLEDGKWYIGQTKVLEKRIQDHFKGNGAEWTKLHKPIEHIKTYQMKDNFDEDKYTLQYMKKYGIDNVRGGSFCQIRLKEDIIKVINRMILSSENKCFICGDDDHYARNCDFVIVNSVDSKTSPSPTYFRLVEL